MTIEKLPSGSYRIKQMYKGKRYSITVDHKPTQKEATILMAEKLQDKMSQGSATLLSCIDDYIEAKNNVLSPSSIRGYKTIGRNTPKWFLNMNIYDIEQVEMQKAVNEYSLNHSPKTVRNFHALMVSAIKMKRPNMVFSTTLPQKDAKKITIPKHDDIIRLLECAKDADCYVAFVLGCLGLRRSEVLALTLEDIDGNRLTINKALVINENCKYILKKTKTTSSTRTIYIPDYLVNRILDQGFVYNGTPNTLIKQLHRYQDKIGMPHCRFHDLRHFYVSYAHSIGMSDADIMTAGGWKTDYIMKSVYRHSMNDASEQERVAKSMFMIDQ